MKKIIAFLALLMLAVPNAFASIDTIAVDVGISVFKTIPLGVVPFEVLADDFAPKGEGFLQGRTPQDKVVIFEGGRKLLGQFVKVRITRAEAWCLHGEVVQ